jgi:hypothetical protein
MENTNTVNNTNSSNPIEEEMQQLELMMGSGVNTTNTLSNASNNTNSSIMILSDEDEEQQEDVDNLIGAFDKAKKPFVLSEEEALLLVDPNNSHISSNSNSNNNSHTNNENSNSITPSNPNDNLVSLNNTTAQDTQFRQVNSPSDPTINTDNTPITENLASSEIANNVGATIKPEGAWNKRLVVIGACFLIIVASLVFHNNSVAKPSPATSNELAHSLPPSEVTPRIADPGLHSYELGKPDGRLPNNRAKQEEPMPKLTIPAEVPPAPTNQPTPVATVSPTKDEPEDEPEDFTIKFRAANKLAAQSLIPKNDPKQAKEEKSPLEGLRIPMQLVDPLRSGIPTKVSAVVIADVTDSLGNTVIPKGSRAQIPFLPFEVQGRVTNDINSNTVIVLPNNQKLTIKGTVKGTDGFAGLSGKVKKQSKGNILARTGKTIGRIGARIVGVETGGIGGVIIEDSINQSVNTSLPFIPSDRVVEIMAGTPFTFNVN